LNSVALAMSLVDALGKAAKEGPFNPTNSICFKFPLSSSNQNAIRAHRGILQVRSSSKFRQRFFLDNLETDVRLVSEYDIEAFQALITYFYTQALPKSSALLDALFRLASSLDMHTIAEKCVNILGGGRGFAMSEIERDMRRLLESGLYADIEIVINQKSFFAHKFILYHRVPYFTVMFSDHSQWTEAHSQKIELKEIDEECFEYVLKYIYCEDESIPILLIFLVYFAADMLVIDRLKPLCLEKIEKELLEYYVTSENVNQNLSSVIEFAFDANLNPLLENCFGYVFANFKAVCAIQEFRLMRKEIFDLMEEKIVSQVSASISLRVFIQFTNYSSLFDGISSKKGYENLFHLIDSVKARCLQILVSDYTILARDEEFNKSFDYHYWNLDSIQAIFDEYEKRLNLNNVCAIYRDLTNHNTLEKETIGSHEIEQNSVTGHTLLLSLQRKVHDFIKNNIFALIDSPSLSFLPLDFQQSLKAELGVDPQSKRKTKENQVNTNVNNSNNVHNLPSPRLVSPPKSQIHKEIALNSRVRCSRGIGVIKFKGTTSFAPGLWFGIELDSPAGLNNGSVNGISYFVTEDKRGVFLHEKSFTVIDE